MLFFDYFCCQMHTAKAVQGSFCLPQEQASLTQEPPRQCHFIHVSMHGCAAGAAEEASRAFQHDASNDIISQ